MIVDEILVSLGVERDGKSDKEIDKFKGDLKELMKDLAKLAAVATAALGSVLAVVVKVSAANYELGNTAERLGVSTAELDAFGHAAEMSGSSAAAMQGALEGLSAAAATAWETGGGAAEAFARLGVQTHDASGKMRKSTDVMLDVADAMQGLDEQSQRKLAGDLGMTSLLPLLRKGRVGIEQLKGEASGLGLVSPKQAELAQQFMDSIEKVKRVFFSLASVFSEELQPVLTDLMGQFMEWVKANREWLDLNLKDAAKEIAAIFRSLFGIFMNLVSASKWLVDALGGGGNVVRILTAAFAAFAGFKIFRIFQTIWQNAGLLKGMLGQVTTAARTLFTFVRANLMRTFLPLTLVVLLLQDIYTFLNGGDSLWGRMLDRFPLIKTYVDLVGTAMATVMTIVSEFIALLSDPFNPAAWQGFADIVVELMKGLGEKLWSFVAGLMNNIIGLLNKLPGVNIDMIPVLAANPAGAAAAVGTSAVAAAKTDRGAIAEKASENQKALISSASTSKEVTVTVNGDARGMDQEALRRAIVSSMNEKAREAQQNLNSGVVK